MALYECTARGGLPGGERWVNVFHFTHDGLHASAGAAISTMLAAFYTNIRGFCGAGWTYSELVVKDVATKQALVFPQSMSGSSTDTNLPNEVSIVCSWQTPVRSRRTRGRTYLAGFTEVANNGIGGNAARPTTTTTGNIRQACETLIGTSQPARLVVYSRIAGTFAEVNSGYVNDEWDTQRRRAKSIVSTKYVFPQ